MRRTPVLAADLAEHLVEGIEPRYPMHEHALASARALLAEHRAEHPKAAALLADAAQRWERFEMPWEQAQALLGRGRCLLELGRPTEASRLLQTAREIFTSLGAEPALAETDALLEEATARTS